MPKIQDFIIEGITSSLSGQPTQQSIDTENPSISLILKVQETLGWEILLMGFINPRIINIQQRPFINSDSRKSGSRWGV